MRTTDLAIHLYIHAKLPFGVVGIKPTFLYYLLPYLAPHHLIIWIRTTASTCLPISLSLFLFISFPCTGILTKMGCHPSISVILPFAYSSDKRVLLFVCVLGETCFLHLDLEGSAYFVLSLPGCLFQNTDFPSCRLLCRPLLYIPDLAWSITTETFSVRLFFTSLFPRPLFLVSHPDLLRLTRVHYPWKIWNQGLYTRVLISLLFLLYLLMSFWANSDKRILSLLWYHHSSHCVYCLHRLPCFHLAFILV